MDGAAEEIEIDTVERKLRRRDVLGDCGCGVHSD